MKKIICIALVIGMVLACGAWTSSPTPRAIDNSELYKELQKEGFTQRGDVWTFETYDDDNIIYAIAWFDVVENYGVMTMFGHIDEDDYKAGYLIGKYVVEWDYEADDFVILQSEEYKK